MESSNSFPGCDYYHQKLIEKGTVVQYAISPLFFNNFTIKIIIFGSSVFHTTFI